MNPNMVGLAALILGLSTLYTVTCNFTYGNPKLRVPNDTFVGTIATFLCQLPEEVTEEILVTFYREEDQKIYGESTILPQAFIATINIKAKLSDKGFFRCKVEAQNKTNKNVSSMSSDKRYFMVFEHSVELVQLTPLEEVFEGVKFDLFCSVSGVATENILYKWKHNDKQLKELSNLLRINEVTQKDAGTYLCFVNNGSKEYVSNTVLLKVKEKVSRPEISFSVYKVDNQYVVNITCQSSRGSLPVNLSINFYGLSNATSEFRTDHQSLSITIVRHISLGRSTSKVQCSISNSPEWLSDMVPFEVVPVGGTTTVQPEYEVGLNFEVVGLTLQCMVEQGTFPSYRWFFNGSQLLEEPEGDFYRLSEGGHSLALTSINSHSFGFYRCEVTNNFDSNSSISSREFLVDQKALKHVPSEVVALVFGCCLLLLSLLVGCCIYGAIHPKIQSTKEPMLNWAVTEGDVTESEDNELVEEEYEEDLDLVKSANLDQPEEFDMESLDDLQELQKVLQMYSLQEEDA